MIRLIIADENQSYLKALAQYLQVEHGHAIEVTCFTQQSALREYLMNSDKVDILLIEQKLLNEQVDTNNIKTVILLTETIIDGDVKAIYKFQKADQITKLLLEAFDKVSDRGADLLKNNNKSKLICVYSPSGATGKSTIANNLAYQYAMQGRKALFISLETFSSRYFLKRNEPAKGLIFLLYLLKSKIPNLQLKLNSITAVDEGTSIHFIERESNVLEYKDIKIEDMELLTDFLKRQSGYDVIILDMDSTINEITLGAFKYCDVIANIICNNNFTYAKQDDFVRQAPKINDLLGIDIFSKVINIVNKYEDMSEIKDMDKSQCYGQIEIPYIHYSNISNGGYFPEMTYFKKLYDMLEDFL